MSGHIEFKPMLFKSQFYKPKGKKKTETTTQSESKYGKEL